MVEFRWIQISVFLVALLRVTAAEKPPLSFTVRGGDEVTLPCENVMDDQNNCVNTTWVFTGLRNTAAVELVRLGQIGRNAGAKSVRLSVTESCSLVIKKASVEDVGHYICQQYSGPGSKPRSESEVRLSVVTMTEQKLSDRLTLNCSVSTYEECTHKVKWLIDGNDVDKDNRDVKTSPSPCSASVLTLTSHEISKSRFHLFTCEVTDGLSGEVLLFPLRPRPSGWWWWLIIAFVGVAALLIIVVAAIRWQRTKGRKTQTDDHIGRRSNPDVTPGPSQDMADPEEGVSYASISYTRKTNSQARALGRDDEAVTYSTVKASSSSAGASADISDLYATVNKPKNYKTAG